MENKITSNLYLVFLVRIWQEFDNEFPGHAPLRIQAENPITGERRIFNTVSELMEFLENEMLKDLEANNE